MPFSSVSRRSPPLVLHIVPLADVPPQPWRNGGGSTQELLTWPSPTAWLVRVSVARIEQHGPFSAFPDIERWFTVIHGAGVRLQFADAEILLGAESDPLQFDGAAPPGCALLDGATQDLNLMVRADLGHGVMHRAAAGASWTSAASFRAIYTAASATLRRDERSDHLLPADSLAWSDEASGQRWMLADGNDALAVRAWWLEFTPRTGNPGMPDGNAASVGKGLRQ